MKTHTRLVFKITSTFKPYGRRKASSLILGDGNSSAYQPENICERSGLTFFARQKKTFQEIAFLEAQAFEAAPRPKHPFIPAVMETHL